MNIYKLEKPVTLYKAQFDKFNLSMTGDHTLDRESLELDSLLFRIKYMTRKNKDLDKIDGIRDEFSRRALHLRQLFNEFLYDFLADIVGIPAEYHLEDIENVLAQDVKIDTTHVKFKMVLFSGNKGYLEYVDSEIPEDKEFNMYPDEFFRYETDSYNDAIAKAYPELFENKHQDKVGTGADGDVFCHNLTFQTSERCSLNCTYCFAAGTKIRMADGSIKGIERVVVGDEVAGFDEKYMPNDPKRFVANIPSKVTATFHRKGEVWKISHHNIENTYVTPEHPIASSRSEFCRDYVAVKDLQADLNALYKMNRDMTFSPQYCYTVTPSHNVEDVYNIETETHTYVANGIAVHNCYQFNKSPMRMQFDTAKEFIDNLLADKYGYINRYNSPAIIIEFIGGEPLLEIELTRQIYEYFLDRCYELNHPWFSLHRLSICSNGLQYFDEPVQAFFKDYASNISFNISIDGNKQLHDSCRIQPNGEGSYDIAMTALNHFNKHYTAERNSKMTLAPSNIRYLFDSVVDFINHGMKCINLNCVFEEGWNQETARIEYGQLRQLADYILDNDLENIYIAIFNERQEDRMDKYSDSSACGGDGSMLAIRPNGQLYPCIRYMPTSVGDNVEDLCIGSVQEGFIGREQNSSILAMMDKITRRSQTNDICFECPLSNDCAACLALGHTVFGTPNKRCSFICIQMIAEALANVYYWNNLLLKHPTWDLHVRRNVVPDEWSLLVIDEYELESLKVLELAAMTKYYDHHITNTSNRRRYDDRFWEAINVEHIQSMLRQNSFVGEIEHPDEK